MRNPAHRDLVTVALIALASSTGCGSKTPATPALPASTPTAVAPGAPSPPGTTGAPAAAVAPTTESPELKELKSLGANIPLVRLGDSRPIANDELKQISFPRSPLPEEKLLLLLKFPKLDDLSLSNGTYSDAAMDTIAKNQSVTNLWLSGVPISDDGLRRLVPLQGLDSLYADQTRITDVGVEYLPEFKKLSWLVIGQNRNITDASVPHLSKLSTLKTLGIEQTSISKEGADKLKAALPACKVNWLP